MERKTKTSRVGYTRYVLTTIILISAITASSIVILILKGSAIDQYQSSTQNGLTNSLSYANKWGTRILLYPRQFTRMPEPLVMVTAAWSLIVMFTWSCFLRYAMVSKPIRISAKEGAALFALLATTPLLSLALFITLTATTSSPAAVKSAIQAFNRKPSEWISNIDLESYTCFVKGVYDGTQPNVAADKKFHSRQCAFELGAKCTMLILCVLSSTMLLMHWWDMRKEQTVFCKGVKYEHEEEEKRDHT